MKTFDHARLLIDAFLLLVAIVCASAFAYQSQHTLPATEQEISMCRQAGDCITVSQGMLSLAVQDVMETSGAMGYEVGRKSCSRGALTL